MISADARASGLGEQGVATSPDAFSQHWNPAKYVFLDNRIWCRSELHTLFK